MKKTLLILTVIIGLISCSKSDTEKINGILIGDFIEVTPVSERVMLQFASETQLSQRITDFDLTPTFTIRLLNDDKLELSCNECDEKQPKIVSYQIINNNKFKIGGFFPAEPTETMTFKRN